MLLRTTVTDDVVALEQVGGLWRLADPEFEGLALAQQQLVRMGPRNVPLVQVKLREVALAIGILASRLP